VINHYAATLLQLEGKGSAKQRWGRLQPVRSCCQEREWSELRWRWVFPR